MKTKKRTYQYPVINIQRQYPAILLTSHLVNYPMYIHFLPGMVDTIFADVAQPDQARIVAINAHNFLKNGGHFVISIKVCVKKLYA